jgi:acetyltransferase-like isoleucine patch superfamily enzyme
MFERYSERARRVLFFARYEASQFGQPYIETEHLLLGLLREDKQLAGRFLHSETAEESVRKQIEARTTIREKVSTGADNGFSNGSKRVVAYAAEEAERLGQKQIGTEHLLLGLLREEKCTAAQILQERGLKLKQIREELVRLPHANPIETGTMTTRPDDAAFRLMQSGVTIRKPETCVIDSGVEVAAGTVIEPFVQLLGRTRVGAECTIRSFTVIENCTLGDRVLVRQSCVLSESTVKDGAKIGPFAHLRPESEIGEDAHVGNFVETKKTKLGKGAKANHLTYLGDADVGAGSNIGAGVITCNYDGVNKHRTQIGAGAFVGSDSTLVAPLNVGEGAYIGAGSCITKDVPADALAVGRSHQVTKEGWAKTRREKQQKKG